MAAALTAFVQSVDAGRNSAFVESVVAILEKNDVTEVKHLAHLGTHSMVYEPLVTAGKKASVCMVTWCAIFLVCVGVAWPGAHQNDDFEACRGA